jgi:hypothetical protein
MNGREEILGIVENGRFLVPGESGPLGGSMRLTSIQRQEARPPESGELNLTEYEGKAIMVSGYVDSGWVYEAGVIDEAGPILTAVVRKVFGQTAS